MTNEQGYLDLLAQVLEKGQYKEDRTGVGCYSIFGSLLRYDLIGGKLPLLTTKHMGIKSILAELLWFIEGSTDNNRLNALGARIWDAWATEDGDLGPIYGKQWTDWENLDLIPLSAWIDHKKAYKRQGYRYFNEYYDPEVGESVVLARRTINQLQNLITGLKENPTSRRHIVNAWNPSVLPAEYEWEYAFAELEDFPDMTAQGWECIAVTDEDATPTHRRKRPITPQENVLRGKAALPPCHAMFQVHTRALSLEERIRQLEAMVPDEIYRDEPSLTAWLDARDVPQYALTLQVFQRSIDVPIGLPYNLASYGLLAHMLAHCTGMVAEELIHNGGDVHIYRRQVEGVKTQLEREPGVVPTVVLNPEVKELFNFTHEDVRLCNYHPHPKIDFGPIAV